MNSSDGLIITCVLLYYYLTFLSVTRLCMYVYNAPVCLVFYSPIGHMWDVSETVNPKQGCF